MGRYSSRLGLWLVAVATIIGATGCGPKSPEEKVANLRSFYSAELNGFLVEEEPIMAEAPEAELSEEEMPEGTEPEAEEMPLEVAPVPVVQKVQLDILIKHRSNERLPGLTVDISMADASGAEKGHWRAWFDTSNVEKATVTQFTHILEDVGYEEGDGFFVEVRHPIPVEERGEYREFAGSS